MCGLHQQLGTALFLILEETLLRAVAVITRTAFGVPKSLNFQGRLK